MPIPGGAAAFLPLVGKPLRGKWYSHMPGTGAPLASPSSAFGQEAAALWTWYGYGFLVLIYHILNLGLQFRSITCYIILMANYS